MEKKIYTYPAVLTIAGSDSGGGAGIQADIKTFSALGCFGCSAITAITVQNTCGVTGVHTIPEDILAGQIDAVISDIQPKAIKIGMIPTATQAAIIAKTLKKYSGIPIVLDPVMIATSGDKLTEDDTIKTIIQELFPIASIITPNLDEASVLTKQKIYTVEEMKEAAMSLIDMGCLSVLIKGGHLSTPTLTDVYLMSDGKMLTFDNPKIDTNNTHGSGCTLSSAIAAYLSRGLTIQEAVEKAIAYIHAAIENGADVKTGNGNGPLNHFFHPEKLIKKPL